ncbi:hypothetical protein [Cryptosporangium phraense]|nr:hypothetical protein [Cryptosporangium phraense]
MDAALARAYWLRGQVAFAADDARRSAYRLIADMAKIPVEPLRAHYTPEQAASELTMIRQTEALLNAEDAAWRCSDGLFWALRVTADRHPLDTALVAWEANRLGVSPRWKQSRGCR